MIVTRIEEWCVEAETAEQARELLTAGDGHRCHLGDRIHAEIQNVRDSLILALSLEHSELPARTSQLNHWPPDRQSMRKKESDLDLAFANKIKESPEFSSWLLSRTRFSEYRSRVRLLDQEQASIRP
jgi:hypothetical protein